MYRSAQSGGRGWLKQGDRCEWLKAPIPASDSANFQQHSQEFFTGRTKLPRKSKLSVPQLQCLTTCILPYHLPLPTPPRPSSALLWSPPTTTPPPLCVYCFATSPQLCAARAAAAGESGTPHHVPAHPSTQARLPPPLPPRPPPSSKDRGHSCVKGAVDVTPHGLDSGRPVGQAAVRADAAAAPPPETHVDAFAWRVVSGGTGRCPPGGGTGGCRGVH